MTDNFLDIIAIIISIISVFVSIYFEIKNRKEPRPYYIVKVMDIQVAIPIEEKDQKTPQTRKHVEFLFFNLGRKTLFYQDLGNAIGLRLEFIGSSTAIKVLESESSSNNNDLIISTIANHAIIKFDHLKRNQFLYFKIEAKLNDYKSVEIKGELKDDIKIQKFGAITFFRHTISTYLHLLVSFIVVLGTIDLYLDMGNSLYFILCFIFGFLFIDYYDNKFGSRLRKKIKYMQP